MFRSRLCRITTLFSLFLYLAAQKTVLLRVHPLNPNQKIKLKNPLASLSSASTHLAVFSLHSVSSGRSFGALQSKQGMENGLLSFYYRLLMQPLSPAVMERAPDRQSRRKGRAKRERGRGHGCIQKGGNIHIYMHKFMLP